MRLHYHPVSPYARKALVAVRHRGDPVALAPIDVNGGGLRTPAFLALSPFGKMPVLETPDEGALIESTSIIEYLEARGPRVLLPPAGARRARHWDRLGDCYFIEQQTTIWFNPLDNATLRARELVRVGWDLLAEALGGKDFLLDQGFSLADIGPAIGSDYLVRLGEVPPPEVAQWLARCFEIPAMAESLADGLDTIERMLEVRRRQLHQAQSWSSL